jgi:hypothetical protein
MDPFKEQKFYPRDDNQPFLEYFGSVFNTVYIGLFSFFTIRDNDFEKYNFNKSVKTTLEQARKQDHNFEKLNSTNATIYSRNVNYPSNDEILGQGTIVTWLDVKNGSGLATNSDLYKALKTSIGAYNEDYSRPDLAKKLEQFTKDTQVWAPGEGQYDVITLRKIYNSFVLLGKRHIIVEDEFLESRKELMLGELTPEEFIEQISGKDYYIYSADHSLLFSLDWDSFFFIICYSSPSVAQIIEGQGFEGFFANFKTTHNWEHD